MRLTRAIGALMLLFAVAFGAADTADAHPGHRHALNDSADVSVSKSTAAEAPARAQIEPSAAPDVDAPALQSPLDLQTCHTGACFCPGVSGCGIAGHCCASAVLHNSPNWVPHVNGSRTRLPPQTVHKIEIVFGLDRPPKT